LRGKAGPLRQLGLDPVFNIPFNNIADLLQIVQDMNQAHGVFVLLTAQGLTQDPGQVVHRGLEEDPGVFVPIAEEAGLMPALGAFVLRRAFMEAKLWPDLEVAINLSPVQFRHVDLVELLENLLVEYEIDPRRIVLEVTEGVLMESSERNRQTLDTIRALGFKIALDDFGTGYSSLRYLCDFRFDKIKIDRAFVTGIHERKRALTIIQSVVTLGRGLGMDIVAEGVETEAEASVMRLVGVTELQGFFFSRAIPAPAIADLVRAFEAALPMGLAPAAAPDVRAKRRS
jgi:EAL domain-containing protein (putative c-di-GMP-specific phosphodiesterase class I)